MVEKRYAGQNKTQRDLNALIDEVAALDHGTLGGLDDDDHPQYAKADDLTAHVAALTGVHGLGIACRVGHNAAQSIPPGTWTVLAYNQTLLDTDDMHSGGDDSRITIKTPGLYLFIASVVWVNTVSGGSIRIRLNGSTIIASNPGVTGSEDTNYGGFVAAFRPVAIDDYVQVVVLNRNPNPRSILLADDYSPRFAAVKIG
jgi:hypothetical protein